jgi:CarD family transcriptional regulator
MFRFPISGFFSAAGRALSDSRLPLFATGEDQMHFSVSDMVVHPIHGAGKISEISVKNISGESTECVVVDLMVGNAGVLLPVESLDDTGLRHIVDEDTIDKALHTLAGSAEELPGDWRRRIESLRERVHSGDPRRVAMAVRDIVARAGHSKVNPSEKRVLSEAIGVLAGEVALVKKLDVPSARKLVERRAGVRVDG